MTRAISTTDPLPLRDDVDLPLQTRLWFEDAQRLVDLTLRALGPISQLSDIQASHLRAPIRRFRHCYRNGHLFGDRFRSAAHLIAEEIAGASWTMRDTALWDDLVVLLRELVDANWRLRRQSLDAPTWREMHETLAVLNRYGGCFPSAYQLLAEADRKDGADRASAPTASG